MSILMGKSIREVYYVDSLVYTQLWPSFSFLLKGWSWKRRGMQVSFLGAEFLRGWLSKL